MAFPKRPLASAVMGVLLALGTALLSGCEPSQVDRVDVARWKAMEASVDHYPHAINGGRLGVAGQPIRLETELYDHNAAGLDEDGARQFVRGVVEWLQGDGWQPVWAWCGSWYGETRWAGTAYRMVDGVSYVVRVTGTRPAAGPLRVTLDLEAPPHDAPADSLARPVPPTLTVGETCLAAPGRAGIHGAEPNFVIAAGGVRLAPAERPLPRGPIDPARERAD